MANKEYMDNIKMKLYLNKWKLKHWKKIHPQSIFSLNMVHIYRAFLGVNNQHTAIYTKKHV